MATDRELLKAWQAGVAHGLKVTDPIGTVDNAHSFWLHFTKASDDAMASTTTSETYTGRLVPVKARLVAAYYVATTGGITANATNYGTITVYKRDSAAANQLAIASFASDTATTDDVTQGAPKALTLTAANVVVDANSTLTFAITKAASGVVFRAGDIWLQFTAV